MDKLKPCPFCGGEGMIKQTSWGYYAEGSSEKCAYIPSSRLFPSEKEARQSWNQRAEKYIPITYIQNEIKRCEENGMETYAGAFMALLYYWEKGEKNDRT